MAARRVLRSASPNRRDEAAGDCGAGDGCPIDVAGGERFGNVVVRRGDVAAFVHDGLLDRGARGGEHFGEHFAAAAGAGEQTLACRGLAVRAPRPVPRPVFVRLHVGSQMAIGERGDGCRADRGKLCVAQAAQVVAQFAQPVEKVTHAVALENTSQSNSREALDDVVDGRPIARRADFDRRLAEHVRAEVAQAASARSCA